MSSSYGSKAHQFTHEEAVVAGRKGWQSIQDKRISRLSGRDLPASVRKNRYTVDDLCKRMEVSEPTFYKIIRSPGANFPKPLNAAPHAGVTVWYPAAECDLWLANNEIGTLAPRKGKRGRAEDTFLAASMGEATVGSVLEFHFLAGSAAIRAFLLSLQNKSVAQLNQYPSRRVLAADGWRNVYAR